MQKQPNNFDFITSDVDSQKEAANRTIVLKEIPNDSHYRQIHEVL